MNMIDLKRLGSLALFAALASGCAVSADGAGGALDNSAAENGDEEPNIKPFAAFEDENLGKVEFVEYEPGELLVSVVTSSHDAEELLGTKGIAELYETLIGEPLPERFESAIESDEKQEAGEDDVVIEGESDGVDVDLKLADGDGSVEDHPNTAEWEFLDYHCDGTMLWCWTNRTGSGSYQNWAKRQTSTVIPYRGTVTHRMQAKNVWNNWKTVRTNTVAAGQKSYIWAYSNVARSKKSEVYNASGDGYHFSGHKR